MRQSEHHKADFLWPSLCTFRPSSDPVFTKVGDSLHKGRRLENFVWRAWHREAHLVSLREPSVALQVWAIIRYRPTRLSMTTMLTISYTLACLDFHHNSCRLIVLGQTLPTVRL